MSATDLTATLDGLADRDWTDGAPVDDLRVAVVGVGGFATGHALPALADADHCEPTVLVSGSPETEAVAEEYGARRIDYADYDDGAAADAYDAVYVSTPNALHLPQVETAARLGKHVVCEKPLEASAERAARLVDTCADAGVELVTAYRLQADPVIRRARDLIRQGAIGDVVHGTGTFAIDILDGGSADQWRLDADLAGGGSLYDIGVYPLNTGRFLLGDDPTAVAGRTASTRDAFDDVEEHVDFRVEFPDCTLACAATYGGQPLDRLAFVGTAGRLVLESAFVPGARRTLRVERGDATATLEGPPTHELRELFDYVAHRLSTGRAIEPDGRDGLVDQRAMDAVYEADADGTRVALDR